MPHRVDDAAFWEQDIALHVPLYVALAMHGHLCLALRHPGTRELESRPMVVRAAKRLGQLMVAMKALSAQELAVIEKLEAAGTRRPGGVYLLRHALALHRSPAAATPAPG
jgi:hypothetical protein